MPKSTLNTFAPSDYAISTAPQTATLPTQLPASSSALNLPTGWFDLGYLSDAGITEAHTFNETQVYDMAGALLRILRNQEQRQWTFECVENDAVTNGLMFPGSTVSVAAGTAEVQTVTITGTPTSGTFSISLPGLPTVNAVYNVTAAALQSLLQSAWDIAVTVALAAGVYTLTFPSSVGNTAQVQVSSNMLPGTVTIASATTTPGVQGVNTRVVGRGLARNLRYFCIDLFDGSLAERYLITQGEAVWTGSVTYSGTALKIAQFTLNTFYDNSTGGYYSKLDNNPAQGYTYA